MPRDSPEFEDENAMNIDNEEKNSNDGGSNAEEDDATEYEIEEILDAKRGPFGGGRIGYLVRWKGYDDSENSWVDEQDIGNAKQLVEEYWRNNSKKGKRKSLEPKRARKSVAADDESDTNSVAKKRGRKSMVKVDSDEDEEPVKNRKTKKAAARGKALEEPQRIHDMAKYMNKENWEDVVDTVETVERAGDGQLWVYFTLITGDAIRELSDICRQRFPQKLIRFYESNLKWKVAEANEDD